MIWKKLTIDTSVEAVDLISEFLSEHSVEGVMIEDNVPLSEDDLKSMFVDIPLIEGENDGTAKVSCFVDDSFDIDGLKADIAAELIRLKEFINVGSAEITVGETSDDSTWQNNWKQYFKPFRLYDNIVILPTWEEFDDIRPDDIVVSIESVMAFGTGTHETTKLCIGQLKKYLKPGQSVFDIGSGSGILSIISVYLGAGYVHGMDIDPDAVKASFENAEANGFDKDRIEFTCGNLLDSNYIAGVSKERTGDFGKQADGDAEAAKNTQEAVNCSAGQNVNSVENCGAGQNVNSVENCGAGQNAENAGSQAVDRKYDIVVANILADVIMPLSAVVRPYMKEDGLFITSGIIDMKEEEVKAELLKNGFEIIDVIHMGEWVSIVCK